MKQPLRHVTIAALAGLGLLLTACSSSGTNSGSSSTAGSTTAPTSSAADTGSATAAPSSSASTVTGTITVLAASSLTGAFNTLKTQFEAANPGATVQITYGSSGDLSASIITGAPADVFASAAPKNMQQVVDKGGATTSTNFVKNSMEIAVPPNNPKGITGVADLAKSGVKVALCVATAPCGATAAAVFTNAKITVKPAVTQKDVKSTLTIIESKEVDAGMVYVTDVLAAGAKVKGIVIPADVNASTEYPIAVLTKAANAAGAAAWVAFVLSPTGAAVLKAAGFESP